MLRQLDRQALSIKFHQAPLATTAPQDVGGRTTSRQARESLAVRGDSIDKDVRLLLQHDSPGPEDSEELLRLVGHVVLGGLCAGTGADETKRSQTTT